MEGINITGISHLLLEDITQKIKGKTFVFKESHSENDMGFSGTISGVYKDKKGIILSLDPVVNRQDLTTGPKFTSIRHGGFDTWFASSVGYENQEIEGVLHVYEY